MRKFLKNIGIVSIPMVIYLFCIALVDPFNYLNISNLIDKSVKKPISAEVAPHMYKLLDQKNNPRKNIVLGDSRSGALYQSMDASIWANMTFGGGSLKEIVQAFWWTVEEQELDTIVIGINLNLYNKYNKRFYVEQTIEALKNYISYASNKNVFRSSFLIVKSMTSREEILLNKTKLSKDEFWEYQLNITSEKFYKKIVYPGNYYSDLVRIADYCNQNEIKLILWIPPTHVDFQNSIKKYHVEDMDEHFKSDLRSLGALYDYNFPSMLTEDRDKFGDPLHFTHEIAVLIRDELTRGKTFCARYSEKENTPLSDIK